MASRKGLNIYIPKYFLAARNCVHTYFCFLGVRGTSLLTCSYIDELRHGRKIICEMNASSYIFNFLEGFCLRFVFILSSIRTYVQPLG